MIRRAEESDLAPIAALHRASILASCAGHYTPEQLAEWTGMQSIERYRALRATRAMFVACEASDGGEANALLGFGVVSPADGWLNAVYVAPSANGQGVGRRLVAALESVALASGCEGLRLHSTPNAVGFYRRLGYLAIGPAVHALPSGSALPCTAMAKALSSK